MNAHFRPMSSRKRRVLAPLAAFLALAAGPSALARADLTIGIESVDASAGSFDVYLTNTGSSAVHVDTTQFEIMASSPLVDLTSATIDTTVDPYIFAGNSLFGPIISTSSGQTLDASDLAGSGDATIAADSSVGLGHIAFTLTGPLSGPVTISFNANSTFTSLAELGINVPIDHFLNGTISISSVPEPASIAQTAVAGLLGGLFLRLRRLRPRLA